MVKSIVFVLLLAGSALQLANALSCYSCTENQRAASALSHFHPLADTTLPACGSDESRWNSVRCTERNPVCSSVLLSVAGQNVLTRSCSSQEADVCSTTYPGGIEVLGCQTCETDLCNGVFEPEEGGQCQSFTLDINVNVNVNSGSGSGSGSGGSGSGGSGSGGSGSGGSGSGGSGSGGSGSGSGNH